MVNYLFEFPYSPVMFLQIYKFCRLSFASSVFSKVDSWCTLFYFDETGCAELLCNILIINTFKDFLILLTKDLCLLFLKQFKL